MVDESESKDGRASCDDGTKADFIFRLHTLAHFNFGRCTDIGDEQSADKSFDLLILHEEHS